MKRWVMAGMAFAAALAAEAGSVVLVGGPELVSRKEQGDDPKTWCLGCWGDELETRVKKGNSVVIFADENPAAFRDPARRAAVTEKVKDGDFVVFALGPDETAAEEAMKEAARARGAKTIRCDVPAMLRALAGKAGRDESLSWYRAVQDGSDFTHTTKRGARILAREFLKALERRGSPLAEFFNPVFRKPDGEAASVPAGGESLSFAPFCEADSAHMEARRTSFGARLALVPKDGMAIGESHSLVLHVTPSDVSMPGKVETGSFRVSFKGLADGRMRISPLGAGGVRRAALRMSQNRLVEVDTAALADGPAAAFAIEIAPWNKPRVIDVAPGGLDSALRQVAAIRARDVLTPLTLRLSPGDYRLEKGLSIDAHHARVGWAPLTIVAADPARRPRLIGGTAVKGWTKTPFNGRDDMWSADVSALDIPERNKLFFFNGRKMEAARWPNLNPAKPYTTGFAYADCDSNAKKPVGMFLDEIPIRAGDKRVWSNPAEGWVVVFPRHNWWNRVYAVTNVTASGVIRLDEKHVPVEQNNSIWDRWCIMGVREELDAPGEWYLDRKGGRIYFIPPAGEDPNDGLATVALAPQIVKVSSCANVVLESLEVTGGNAGVVVQWSDDVAVRGCSVHDIGFHGGNGVVANGRRIEVRDNDIWNIGGHGVFAAGPWSETSFTDRAGTVVENNYIHHVGQVNSHGIGVFMQGQGSAVRHNYIHDAPRCGIYGYGRFCDIAYNRIRHVNTVNDDTGAIYGGGWTEGMGSTVRFNRISDSIGFQRTGSGRYSFFKGACGIYPDEGCGGLKVYGNLVENCHHSAMLLHNGRWIAISNNVFISNGALPAGVKTAQLSFTTWNSDADNYFMRSRRDEMSRRYHRLVDGDHRWLSFPELAQAPDRDDVCFNENGSTMMGVQVRNNILYYPDQGRGMMLVSRGGLLPDRNPFDGNVYWPGQATNINMYAVLKGGWSGWLAAGQDVHSVIADPLFRDAPRRDYRLRPESPALALGFKELPYSEMGLVPSRLRPSMPKEAEGLREHPEWLDDRESPSRAAVSCGTPAVKQSDRPAGVKQSDRPGGVWISGNANLRTTASDKPAPVLSRRFTLDAVPGRAELTLAVAGWCEVSVNGRRVGDTVLSPVTCQPNLRISSLSWDITPFLVKGGNVVEVLLGNGWFNCFTKEVWGFSDASWLAAPMVRGELVADGRTLFATDGEWRVFDSPIIFNALRNGEWYDARLEGSHGNERRATVVKYTPYARVTPEDAAPCRAFDPIAPVRSFPAADGGTIYDFGSNRAGWCEIEIEGDAGAKVTMDYDELVTPTNSLLGYVNCYIRRAGEERPSQHDEYTLAGRPGGERWHPRFTYHGFRYVRVRTEGRVALKSIRSVFVHSDFESAGSFSISDPVFAKLVDAARRSYLSNFVGIPTDCPHREKNGWTGDAQLAMETGLWNFNSKSGYLHFLRMAIDSQRPDGAVPCIIPCTDKFGFKWGSGPAWDAVIFEIPQQIYRFYGDDRPAREAYPAMKRYLAFIEGKARADGLVDYGLGDWCAPKGTKVAPVLLTDSAYVYEFCRRAAFWAERFGERDEAAAFRARAERLKSAFNKEFYKGNGIYAGGEATSLAAPLYFKGLCADGEERKVAEQLVRRVRENGHRACFGILGAKWVPRVLSDHGFIDDSYRIFVQPETPGWAVWMKDNDTLLEKFDEWETSHNHIMFGDFSAWAFEYLAGIKILKPGFAAVDIRPHLPDGVDSFSAEYRSPAGTIRVRARREGGRTVFEKELP